MGTYNDLVNKGSPRPLFLLLTVFFLSVCPAFGQSPDEYKVYDAVIRHMFAGGVTRFDMNAKIDQIVIRDRTHSAYAWGPDKENWDQVKIRLRSLSDETIAGYESARRAEVELKPKLDIPFKYLLMTDKRLSDLIPDRNDYDRSSGYWKEFYEVYPKSAGYNSFSRVGFDKTKRQALVYFVNWCGRLCGTGSYLLIEKGQNGWEVKESAGIWIS